MTRRTNVRTNVRARPRVRRGRKDGVVVRELMQALSHICTGTGRLFAVIDSCLVMARRGTCSLHPRCARTLPLVVATAHKCVGGGLSVLHVSIVPCERAPRHGCAVCGAEDVAVCVPSSSREA